MAGEMMEESVEDYMASEVKQDIYQPGDGTRYRFIVTKVPHEYPGQQGSPHQSLVTISTGAGGRSVFLGLDGTYLDPSYPREKMGEGSDYLSLVFAHWVNMNYCNRYGEILTNAMSGKSDHVVKFSPFLLTLPHWLRSDDAIEKELGKLSFWSAQMENLDARFSAALMASPSVAEAKENGGES